MDLSVLIPSRNEIFLKNTIEDILQNMRGDTEIIAVCDGSWPDPPVKDHPSVHLIYHAEPIGQRAAVNEAANLSTARYVMKLDAHCAVDEGFDMKLMEDCQSDWTVIPRMYNLHAFDWVCDCGHRIYQGPTPEICPECGGRMEREIIWKPKPSPETDFMCFDADLRFQYWSAYKRRAKAQGDIVDLMCCLGACWFMERQRFLDLGGLDEGHGFWGQVGVELACKSWLSGGRMVVNKRTWFAHMFRTQGGDFGFPYQIRGSEQKKAREYSKELWLGNKWPQAVHPLSWLVRKFAPVPGWTDDGPAKGIIFYTNNRLNLKIAHAVQKQLRKIGLPIVSASLKPMPHFGRNVCLSGHEPGYLTLFKQIVAALEASDAEIIFFCEHDVLYHPSHFEFVPPRRDVFYYNQSCWKVDAETGQALFYYANQTSGLCAYRELLLEHYRKRVQIVERDGFTRRMGFEPGTHNREERVDDYKAEAWMSEYPNIDIRHQNNLTPSRWRKDQFRNQKYTQGWTEADEVPGWGQTGGRFEEFLADA